MLIRSSEGDFCIIGAIRKIEQLEPLILVTLEFRGLKEVAPLNIRYIFGDEFKFH